MKKLLEVSEVVSRWMDGVAGTVLVLIMLLTSLDVILRYLNRPITGTYDMVSMGAAFVFGFAIPRTSIDRSHISVDILVEKFPRGKRVLAVSTRILGLLFFFVLGWYFIQTGRGFVTTGDSTQTLSIPLYPVAFALAVCAFVECFVLLSDIGRAVLKEERP
jgi:TRAP-type C4-dicarboxylate transport system permease small subunit